jgi:hypothetical protein
VIGRCIHNNAVGLGGPGRAAFYGEGTTFELELNKLYPIVGLGLFETVLLALVCDETGKPNWLPIGLFEIENAALPTDWEFALIDGAAASGGDSANRWVAQWGYAELVRDVRHSDALIERDPGALKVFYDELKRRTIGED